MFLLTGFPGFLGTEIILRILKKNRDEHFLCLVQEKFLPLAEKKRQELALIIPNATSRVSFVLGDITLPGLGLKKALTYPEITEMFHFAAVYDLNVEEALAKKVNVTGTQNVLEFCAELPNFDKLHYVSTCYVSGRHDGVFRESDLALGQTFNNFYESTKYEAEVLVRESMKNGLRATIYRPAIVVGNSKTGETQKFDGPYFVMQWLLRQSKYALLPRIGQPELYTLNLVPSDYVLDAMAYLCNQESSVSKTFQLADPHPLTVAKVVETIARDCEKTLIELPVSKGLAKWAVGSIPGLESWLGIPRSSLDYFIHPTRYDTTETQSALKNTPIQCPAFESYSQKLVEYMKKTPEIRSKPLV